MNKLTCMACEGDKIIRSEFHSDQISIFFCQSCSLHFLQQEKIPHNQLRERYQKGDFWDDASYNLEKMLDSNFTNDEGKHFALNWSSMFAYCKRYLSKNQKILEIGVGTGVHMIMFDKNGYDITGIEPDTRNTTLINKKLKFGNCINGFVEDQTFENKFDIIWLYHVVEHIVNPKNLLEYCYKFLKPNGLVIIAVPDCDNLMSLKDSIDNPDHLWHFTKKSLTELSSKMNYKIEKIDSMTTIKDLNKQRIHTRFSKYGFSSINQKIWPYWPLKITKNNDGYEIRIVLRKTQK